MRSLRETQLPRSRGRGLPEGIGANLIWLLPVAVIALVYFSPRHVASATTVLTGCVALVIVIAASRRPDLSLLGLIIFLPFSGLILAKLWALGVPASVDSHLGAWKESLALGVIVAGIRNLITTEDRLDGLDGLALAFVGIVLVYALLQTVIVPGAPSPSNVRLLGFRETAGFVLLLFGARHAPLPRDFARRALRTAFIVGTIVAVVGVYSAIFSSAWNRFVVHTIKYTQYQVAVLHTYPVNPNDIRVYGLVGGTKIVRIGSVFLDELQCAWYLILPFAIGIERLLRRDRLPLTLLCTIFIGAALLLTQTRSAILGAVLVAILALAPAMGRPSHWRTQVALVLGTLALIGIPAAFATGVAKRVETTTNKNSVSTAGHISGFWSGVNTMGSNPLGLGLGTGAGTGQRFKVSHDVIPENNYLEVGDELGILPGILFVILTLAVLVKARRLSRQRPEMLVMVAWTAGVGLVVAAWFLQTWASFAVSWGYWGLAGAALGVARHRARATAPAGQAAEALPYRPAVAGPASSAS